MSKKPALDIARHSQMVQDNGLDILIDAINRNDPTEILPKLNEIINIPFEDTWVIKTTQQYEMTFGYDITDWGKGLQGNLNNDYNWLLRNLPDSLLHNYNKAMLEIQYDIASGKMSFEQAASSLIERLNWEGRILRVNGRNYRLDKYARLRVRDAMRDAANASAEKVAAEMGTDVFMISSHGGPRPLCAPYQGWLVSNNPRELILDGQIVDIRSWADTSYGEIAGLFGKNCRHYQIPVSLDGALYPDWDWNKSPLEEFNKIYW